MRRALPWVFMVAGCLAVAGRPARSDVVPGTAPIESLRVKCRDGDLERVLYPRVASTTSEYFIFPVLDVVGARIEFADGSSGALVDANGQLVTRYLHERGDAATISIRVQDVLQSGSREALIEALSRSDEPAVRGKQRLSPALQTEWSVQLEAKGQDGAFVAVGAPYKFDRANDAPTFGVEYRLTLKAGDLRGGYNEARRLEGLLEGADGEDARLVFRAPYAAKFEETECSVNAAYIDTQTKKIIDRVVSKAGGQQAVLFVPVGGDSQQSLDLQSLLTRQLVVSLERRKGSGQTLSPELVRLFLEKMLDQYTDRIRLSDQSMETITSFLLSSGVRVTTTIGNATSVVERLKKENEEATHDLLETSSRTEKSVDVGAGASVDILDIIGLSGDAEVKYHRLNENQQREVRDRYRRDLDEMERMVNGSFPSVAAMRLEQLQTLTQGNWAKSELTSRTFEDVTLEFRLPCLLGSPALRGPAPPSTAFREAVMDCIAATPRGFAGKYEPDADSPDFGDCSIRLPGLSGGTGRVSRFLDVEGNLRHAECWYDMSFPGDHSDVDVVDRAFAELWGWVRQCLPPGWQVGTPGVGGRGGYWHKSAVAAAAPDGPRVEVGYRLRDGRYYLGVEFSCGP